MVDCLCTQLFGVFGWKEKGEFSMKNIEMDRFLLRILKCLWEGGYREIDVDGRTI